MDWRGCARSSGCGYLEYLCEHVANCVYDFVVVVLEGHLHVESDELRQVAVGV